MVPDHPLLGEIKLPWESDLNLLCTAGYGSEGGSSYHCDMFNAYYALDFDRPWEGSVEPETKILAIADGRVDFVDNNPTGFGLHIKIFHESNGANFRIVSLYAHLKRLTRCIKEGRYIKQGQCIGLLGETGKAAGPHLHFQLLINEKCFKDTAGAKPEPISGYSDLKPGKWYRSDNKLWRR